MHHEGNVGIVALRLGTLWLTLASEESPVNIKEVGHSQDIWVGSFRAQVQKGTEKMGDGVGDKT